MTVKKNAKPKKPSLLVLSQRSEDPSTAGPDRALCQECKLDQETTNPYLNPLPPKGWSGNVMLVGEGPGAEEERTGKFFQGRAGNLLDELLEKSDWKRSDVHIWNAVRCRPKNNAAPSMRQIRCCRPYLLHQIETLQPKVVVAMGASAAKALSNDGSASVVKMRGRPQEINNAASTAASGSTGQDVHHAVHEVPVDQVSLVDAPTGPGDVHVRVVHTEKEGET